MYEFKVILVFIFYIIISLYVLPYGQMSLWGRLLPQMYNIQNIVNDYLFILV
jgi:hypothetical protein